MGKKKEEKWKNETPRKDVRVVRDFGCWEDCWKSPDIREEGEMKVNAI